MTGDAVLEIAHPFTTMDRCHGFAGMFVTAVTGVFFKVLGGMASRTGNIVARVQCEKFRMVESRRLPFVLRVTIKALPDAALMDAIVGLVMTGPADFSHTWLQRLMGKCEGVAIGFHSLMVAVTGDTLLICQRVMKRGSARRVARRRAFGDDRSVLRNLMAGQALLRGGAAEELVAREAIFFQR